MTPNPTDSAPILRYLYCKRNNSDDQNWPQEWRDEYEEFSGLRRKNGDRSWPALAGHYQALLDILIAYVGVDECIRIVRSTEDHDNDSVNQD